MQLKGKLAIVTGGGRGIGRGIVDRFLDEGAHVAVVQRRAPDAGLMELPGVFFVEADLGDRATISVAVDRAADLLGGIDVVVNNAGIMSESPVADLTPDEWDRLVAVNLTAPLFLVQAALPHLRRRGGGSIVHLGSIEGLAANPEHAAYCTTKAGIHGMTRALAVDLGPDGIRCNAIAPGWIASELSEDYLSSMPDPRTARDALDGLHPVGRTGTAADIGDLAVFLAGDRAGFITGEVVTIDGGRTARLPLPR